MISWEDVTDLRDPIQDFLQTLHPNYPGIENWWKQKVLPQLGTPQRICRVVRKGTRIAAVSVSKMRGSSAKLCSLCVTPEFRGLRLGSELLRRFEVDARLAGAKQVHLTISEPSDFECGAFFRNKGFVRISWKRHAYVRGVDEIVYRANL